MRSRWEWTHTYGVHLLVASITAVVLSGSGLIAVVSLTGDPDQPPPSPSPGPSLSPSPGPSLGASPSTTPVGTDECVVGSWLAEELVDIGFTGTWTLIAGGPIFEYRQDSTGVIDYGDPEQGDHHTTFEFKDDIFGGTSESVPSGQREFRYELGGGAILHTYLNPLGGAEMLGLPYNPAEDAFDYQCSGDSMSMQGERGSVTLERRTP